jgi:hypothetical protein
MRTVTCHACVCSKPNPCSSWLCPRMSAALPRAIWCSREPRAWTGGPTVRRTCEHPTDCVLSRTAHGAQGRRREQHSTELCAMKPRRMGWAAHAARMGEGTNWCNIFVEKPEATRPVGWPLHRQDDIKMQLTETERTVFSWLMINSKEGLTWTLRSTSSF